MSAALPGGDYGRILNTLLMGTEEAASILDAYEKTQAAAEVFRRAASICEIRANYLSDTSVQDRVDRILDQMFLVAKAADAIHNALLPGNVGAFQAADHAINMVALLLQTEMANVISTQTLPPTEPATLENETLKMLGALGRNYDSSVLSRILSFEPDSYLTGTLEIVGSARIIGKVKGGVLPDFTGSDALSRADALNKADFTLDLTAGSDLKITGAVFGRGADLAGEGTADAIKGWLFNGGEVDPGHSPGKLTFGGDFVMKSGLFRMEIGGATPASFDQVEFLDAVSLRGGAVRVLVNGFTPSKGESLPLFLADTPLDFSRMRLDLRGVPDLQGSLQSDGRIYFVRPDHLGTPRADDLSGGRGGDTLLGLQGADRLSAGAGSDKLIGGPGADVLRGGPGADTFIFLTPADSPASKAADVIADFRPGQDRIDFAAIDPDLRAAGDQTLDFIGGHTFDGATGQLRYRGGIVAADLDGDGRADLRVELVGLPHLHGGDLVL